jgi:MATE family multidrug resistance protein
MPLAEHVRRTLRLAGPVMLARAGLVLMVTVDTVMCGWAGADQLALYAIALVPQVALMLVGIGLVLGTAVLSAQRDGAGKPEDCGRIWRFGLLNAAVLGGLFALLLLPGERLLLALGQAPEIAGPGGDVVAILGLGLPGLLLFSATSALLEGISRPRAGMLVMLAANLVNLALNALLIFGPWQLGAIGAALATTITRWLMFVALAADVLTMADRRRFGIAAPLAGHWRLERQLLRLGWPMALSFALEHAAFGIASVFAGWLGAVPLAAYQIVLNVMSVIYMLAIGLAVATGVRVGNAVGRGDPAGVAQAGWTGLALAGLLMLGLMPLMYLASPAIARTYSAEPAVLALAAPGLAIASWLLLVDALQGVATGALRGMADLWAVAAIQLLCFWGIAIPSCHLLAFDVGYGVVGLLFGLCFGLASASLLLVWRFRALTVRALRPV